ncbi:GNAT family N-acetyltransferase [Allomuricauda sp. F6463D]|uniref:GNAT family N-acetyltransferase n=1 Tax=Allomuricauda sp. F6463D TaxID=2926409 RepID=UPI001FF1DE9E|nr:GNAT family N-acetyltransferase [Muricauda sp. F6463D]MCK0159301.1 GNAT family N-acetyltransferase [Muricauda sp. F6463D]
MNLSNKEHLSLLTDFHLKSRVVSDIYSYLSFSGSSQNNLIENSIKEPAGKKIYSFANVPDYVKSEISDPTLWTERTYPSIRGYAINLAPYQSIEVFLKTHLSKRRKNIFRSIRRLEQSFDIKYQMYLGDIDEENYRFLMGRLKDMIIKRFEQKGHKSDSLAPWDKVFSTSMELIKAGKASIFVVYNQTEPIVISLNYNYGNVLFSYISSYDIDYAKFSPGQIELCKQLEWCINNGYEHFDMGWGDMEYKKWWSNKIYKLNHHIFYPKKSLKGFLYALAYGNKSRIMAVLISKGVNTRFHNFKKKLKNEQKKYNHLPEYQLKDFDISSTVQLEKIELDLEKLPITKQIINDFLFLSQEQDGNVEVYHNKNEDVYILKGKKVAKIILFNPANN